MSASTAPAGGGYPFRPAA